MGYMLNTVDVNNQSVFYVINLDGSGLLADHGSPKVPKWTSEHGHMSSRYAVHVATASWQGYNSRFMLKRVAWRFSMTGWIQGTIPSSIARTGVPTCPKQPVDFPIVGFFSSPENARPPWSKKTPRSSGKTVQSPSVRFYPRPEHCILWGPSAELPPSIWTVKVQGVERRRMCEVGQLAATSSHSKHKKVLFGPISAMLTMRNLAFPRRFQWN